MHPLFQVAYKCFWTVTAWHAFSPGPADLLRRLLRRLCRRIKVDQLGPKKLKNLKKCLKLLRKTPGVFAVFFLCVCVCVRVFQLVLISWISQRIHPLSFWRDFRLIGDLGGFRWSWSCCLEVLSICFIRHSWRNHWENSWGTFW